MYCGDKTAHTKKRGKIHRCDWCGQNIELGERYETWLYFDAGDRVSVYAHAECGKAWDKASLEEGDFVISCMDNERPEHSPQLPTEPIGNND